MKMNMPNDIIKELVSIAKEMVSRPDIQEVVVNLTSSRITVVVDPNFLETKLRNLLDEARRWYMRFGTLKGLKESDIEDGLFELAISIKGEFEDLENAVKKRGDYITGLERKGNELIVRILLKSSSVERVIESFKEAFSKPKFIVEYSGAELEASKTAIFTPFMTPTGEMSAAHQFSLSIPLKYRAYLDLCLRLDHA